MKKQFMIPDLTPIELYDRIYFKRDDLYKPYSGIISELGGTKVRQVKVLVDNVIEKYGKLPNGLITATSVNSPQGLIVAAEANYINVPCILCVGVKYASFDKSISTHKSLVLAKELGAEIRNVAGTGFDKIIAPKAQAIADELDYEMLSFGLGNIEFAKSIIEVIADQVENIPDNLDNLIVTCGSGITLAGIIVGVNKFKKNVKRIMGVQIAGYDRREKVNSLLKLFDIKTDYEFFIDTTYKYSKNVTYSISSEFDLNVKYESKAFLYLLNSMDSMNIHKDEKTLFWCVGNNNFIF